MYQSIPNSLFNNLPLGHQLGILSQLHLSAPTLRLTSCRGIILRAVFSHQAPHLVCIHLSWLVKPTMATTSLCRTQLAKCPSTLIKLSLLLFHCLGVRWIKTLILLSWISSLMGRPNLLVGKRRSTLEKEETIPK